MSDICALLLILVVFSYIDHKCVHKGIFILEVFCDLIYREFWKIREKKTVWNTQGFYNIEEKFGFRKGTLEVLFDVNINLFQIFDKKHRKEKET